MGELALVGELARAGADARGIRPLLRASGSSSRRFAVLRVPRTDRRACVQYPGGE